MADIWNRVDEAIDTDPLLGTLAEVLAKARAIADRDAALAAPTDTAETTGNYVHITYGPWDSSGHQCGDLVVGGCDEPVPSRLVTVHYAIDSEQVIGSELGDCPNRCLAALAVPESTGGDAPPAVFRCSPSEDWIGPLDGGE